jgi:hypothetical protein
MSLIITPKTGVEESASAVARYWTAEEIWKMGM